MAKVKAIAIGGDRVDIVDKTAFDEEVTKREQGDVTLLGKIGTLDNLATTNKTSLVEAVNSLYDTRVEANPVGVMLVNYLFPIGSVYISLDATFNPNDAWQGTNWELIEAGRYLRATQTEANVGKNVEAGLPGGERILTSIIRTGASNAGNINIILDSNKDNNSKGNNANTTYGQGSVATTNYKFNDNYTIYGKSDTVTPESIDVFMWQRIPNYPIIRETEIIFSGKEAVDINNLTQGFVKDDSNAVYYKLPDAFYEALRDKTGSLYIEVVECNGEFPHFTAWHQSGNPNGTVGDMVKDSDTIYHVEPPDSWSSSNTGVILWVEPGVSIIPKRIWIQ